MISIAFLRLPIWLASLILGSFSFFVTLIITPIFIKAFKKAGITGKDMNKRDKPEVAEMGGIVIIAGFSASLLPAIAVSRGDTLVLLLAILCTALITVFIGVLDDILGWKKGIRQWQHALLPVFASFPLIAVMAGNYVMKFPIIGQVNFGILYPLFLIPLGITGASNAVNMLGGMNGLRTGLCLIISIFLGLFGLVLSNAIISSVSFALAGTLLAFLIFNWYPAKIFPGDTGTMAMGAIISSIVIIGNIEKMGLLLFLLFFVELFLKLRSKFQAENWGIIQEDGILKPMYKKSFSLTQFVMKRGKFKEHQVALIILGMQLAVSLISLFLIFL